MSIRVAINGFGRIGRLVLRIAQERLKGTVDIVAINARANDETLAHLFKYDSSYGKFRGNVKVGKNSMIVNGSEIKIFREKDPENLPWDKLNVDIVVESTGKFKTREGLYKHIEAGAKRL